jgi:hypothetical protein
MTSLDDLDGTRWAGTAELWLDPLGDNAERSDSTLSIDGQVVSYTWRHEGAQHRGSITLKSDGAEFTDTWHQAKVMECEILTSHRGLFQVQGVYGPEEDWGWRVMMSWREPTDELVLQMTNIAPWGEEARAVRMVGSRE